MAPRADVGRRFTRVNAGRLRRQSRPRVGRIEVWPRRAPPTGPRRLAGATRARSSTSPEQAGLVLISLILVAAVANLNLSVANVALPDIGESFDSSQTMLDLIAVGYSLGLAASVLWFGAIGDRYGRKLMIVLGMCLSVPASLLAGFAPSDTVLFARPRPRRHLRRPRVSDDARADHGAVVGPGADQVDRALVRARRRHRAARAARVGRLLEYFDWGSVFLVTLPLVASRCPGDQFVPAHVNETTEPVDNLGGSCPSCSSAR